MYGKLFASLYQGTLRGRAHEILVFTNLLAHCDRDGFVDKHFRAIAEEVGLTVDEVKSAIANLEAPDPESRSPEEAGARLVRMDEHRVWGWRVVNYAKYRAIRDVADRQAQNREAQARHRIAKQRSAVSRRQPQSAAVSQAVPSKPPSAHAEAEAEAEAEQKVPSRPAGAGELTLESPKPPASPAKPSEAPEGCDAASKAPKAAGKSNGDDGKGVLHARFIAEWVAAFEHEHGFPYKMEGGKDGKAVKDLLRYSSDVDELIALAQSAWRSKGPKFFWCEKAVSISAFATRQNEIRAELGSVVRKPDDIADLQAKDLVP